MVHFVIIVGASVEIVAEVIIGAIVVIMTVHDHNDPICIWQ